ITGNTTSPAVWRTLSILRVDGPLRIGALATSSRVSQPTMTKLLAGLVEQELVYRIADVEDSRAWLIALSAAGEDAISAYRSELGTALAPLFADLSDDDRLVMARAADILAQRSTNGQRVLEKASR
ncbi:MAG: MarR family transcriptional regulator, partial [Burkholderiaceae bacterium]|nr:MarR family transcriptional regulator [Microbacteriaceae bacterium]